MTMPIDRSSENGIEYANVSHFNTGGGLWLAWYPNLPLIRGTGASRVESLRDLRSRERMAKTDLEITYYTLGNKIIVRSSEEPDKYGIGSSSTDALKDHICQDDPRKVMFTILNPKAWGCCLDDKASGTGKTAKESYVRANEAYYHVAGVKLEGAQLGSNAEGWTVSRQGSMVIGTGPTVGSAIASWETAWSSSMLDGYLKMVGHHNGHPNHNSVQEFVKYVRGLEKKVNG